MRFLSLFSGIEAASLAWVPLGWECVAVAEIEPFPCKVLAHHYPKTPNLGDITKITEQQIKSLGHIDLVVGGFPCQDLSIAGKRKGLKNDDGSATRSGLFYTAMQITRWTGARWLVLENVPGIYSSNQGLDFASMVGEILDTEFAVPKEGWRNSGVAVSETGLLEWRTLDAQYVRTDGYPYAVPQRRRRVFVVGYFGDWRRAAPVLFDRESLSGNPPPSRRAGQKATGFTASSFGQYSEGVGTVRANGGDLGGGSETLCVATGQANAEILEGLSPTLNCAHEQPIVTYGLPGNWIGRNPKNGGNAVEPMIDIAPCQTKTDVHAVAFHSQASSTQSMNPSEVCPTLDKSNLATVAFKVRGGCEGGGKGYLGSEETAFTLSTTQDQQVAFYENHPQDSRVTELVGACSTVTKNWGTGGGNVPYAQMQMQVRRLTPTECARLQGFPDFYLSQVPGASDSAMYKALGNSMAVNVMQVLGIRIAMVDAIADIKAVA